MYDVIVVGARAAGAATAMLLARQGRRVLAVDRARFPSDTLSTHQIQPPGVALLRRWGLLDKLLAAGSPVTDRVRFDIAGTVLDGRFPQGGLLCSPRRTVLDALLVDAARAAGAEVREGFHVAGLIHDGARVAGIRGRDGGVHRAALVVGADGKHSLVAREAGAAVRRDHGPLTAAMYSYWAGVEVPHGELYQRGGRAVAAFPTNDGLTMVYVAAPPAEFTTWGADREAQFLATLDGCGDLGDRVRSGRRAERLRGTVDLPNRVRAAHGPGWVLVGDAGLVMDPVTAQGIGNAFGDAERLADAVANVDLDARENGDENGYERTRDQERMPMFELTQEVARLAAPDWLSRLAIKAVARRERNVEQFLGVFAGTVPVRRMRSPANLVRVLLSGLAGGRWRRPRAACRR